jgi:heat shock protein HslJ
MRKLIMIMLTLAAVTAMMLGGCSSSSESRSLADTSWVLVSYGNPDNLTSVIEGTEVTLNFNSTTDQVSGNGSVNGYGGDCVRSNDQLTVSSIMHTEMASLDPAINEQENTYFSLLGSAESVEFGKDTLTINCSGGQVLNFDAA